MKRNRSFFQKKSGSSLIEFLVALGIFLLIGAGVSLFARDLFVYSGGISNTLSAEQDARNILRTFGKEVRGATISANGSYPIETAGANELVYYSDIDSDGVIERVRYYMNGTTFKKDVWKPTGSPAVYSGSPSTKSLLYNMANGGTDIFSYYDSSYDGTTNPLSQPVDLSKIRLIRVNLIIEQDPNRLPTPVNVMTQVMLRNLKDNL